MDPETPYVITKSCEITRPNQADVLPAGTQLVQPRTRSSSSTLPSDPKLLSFRVHGGSSKKCV